MITLIVGKKGSGKTKKLIQLANDAVKTSNGNVVCIEKGAKLTYDIDHNARLIDSDQYVISGFDALYGFVSGICAGNYDVTDILIDSTLKIGGNDMEQFEKFAVKVNELARLSEVKVTISVSADESEIPDGLKDIAEKA